MADRVLLVEDDFLLQLATRKALEIIGYDCVVVDNGEAAVEKAGLDTAFDIVLMDINLPGIDGIEATRQIRKNEAESSSKRIPIVALTSTTNIKQCLQAGMDDFMSKPALMDDLKNMITKWTVKPA